MEFARLREAAYRELFEGDAVRVHPHELFQKPRFGGRIEVRVYELPYDQQTGQVYVAVTSGLSDYHMVQPQGGSPYRREVIQYFRECRAEDIGRLHDVAWVPLAGGFSVDFLHTAGPMPGEWPGSLFLHPLVTEHAEWKLPLHGEEMQLLWHVPLRQAELDFKLKNGVDALLERMQEIQLPWIFDPLNGPLLV